MHSRHYVTDAICRTSSLRIYSRYNPSFRYCNVVQQMSKKCKFLHEHFAWISTSIHYITNWRIPRTFWLPIALFSQCNPESTYMSESESIRLSSFEFHSQKIFALSLPSFFINCKSFAKKWVICSVFNASIYFMRRKCCICYTINNLCFGIATKYLPVSKLASKLSRPSAMISLLRKAWLAFCEYLSNKYNSNHHVMMSFKLRRLDATLALICNFQRRTQITYLHNACILLHPNLWKPNGDLQRRKNALL